MELIFIGNDASRTGAPILLLNFLKWLKINTKNNFIIILNNDGELRSEFEKLGTTYVFYEGGGLSDSILTKIKHKILGHPFNKNRTKIVNDIKDRKSGLIFSNTLVNGKILEFLSFLELPVITYAHELPYIINSSPAIKANLKFVLKYTKFFLCGSRAVQNNLVNTYKIQSDNITVLNSYIPVDQFASEKFKNKENIKQKHNIPSSALVIGAIGSVSWRKGSDLFVLVAKYIAEYVKDVDVHFLWVGADYTGVEYEKLMFDIKTLGLQTKMHIIESTPHVVEYLNAFDVFLLTSREDPFPVVVVEAAAMEKPIICFDRSGGIVDFVRECGLVVSYMGIYEMAQEVIKLIGSKELRNTYGARAKTKAIENHDVNKAGLVLLEHINKFYKKQV